LSRQYNLDQVGKFPDFRSRKKRKQSQTRRRTKKHDTRQRQVCSSRFRRDFDAADFGSELSLIFCRCFWFTFTRNPVTRRRTVSFKLKKSLPKHRATHPIGVMTRKKKSVNKTLETINPSHDRQ